MFSNRFERKINQQFLYSWTISYNIKSKRYKYEENVKKKIQESNSYDRIIIS